MPGFTRLKLWKSRSRSVRHHFHGWTDQNIQTLTPLRIFGMCWNPSLPSSTQKKRKRKKEWNARWKWKVVTLHVHINIMPLPSSNLRVGKKYYSVTFFLLFIINNGQDFLYYSSYTHNYTRSVLLYIMQYSFGSCALIFWDLSRCLGKSLWITLKVFSTKVEDLKIF